MTHTIGERNVALVDLLDRLLEGGVVLSGDLTLAIADVDLVRISLRALICPVEPDHDGATATRRQPCPANLLRRPAHGTAAWPPNRKPSNETWSAWR